MPPLGPDYDLAVRIRTLEDELRRLRSAALGATEYAGPTATTASAGSNGAVPAQVAGYMTWQIGGATVKIPYFNA